MSEILNVEKREITGTLRMRRLRASGMVPAVLYGHGEGNVHLSVKMKDLDSAIRHGQQVVQLKGGVNESALIKEVQWDGLGSNVMHIDLTRIDMKEMIEVTLQIEFKGVAPGTKQGGVLKHLLHEVDIACPANKLPDNLEININELELGDSLTLEAIELPEGAKLVGDVTELAIQCVEPSAEVEEETEGDAAAEPEVIGRKADDEESDD